MQTQAENILLLAKLAAHATKALVAATGEPSEVIDDGARVTRGITGVYINGILMGLECAAQNAPESREQIDAAAEIYREIASAGGLNFSRVTTDPA